jgi:predicted TIM-barrel fold metal-dependent hydrolase
MANAPQIAVNAENQWRTQTPGAAGWERSARPDAANKYLMISCDAHLGPPPALFAQRMDEKYRSRVPRMEKDADGVRWLVIDGARPTRILEEPLHGEDDYRSKAGSSGALDDLTSHLDKRMADNRLDGIDGELVFPNGVALFAYWTHDADFSAAQLRCYNDWAAEATRDYRATMNVAAGIATANVDVAVAEVQRVAKMGYRTVLLPNKPVFGSKDVADNNYNLPVYDPLWAAIQEADLAVTFHVSTGNDPRGARGNGGAIINYVVHSLSPTIEPMVSVCASGVFDRFPGLRFATIEAGAGFVPWMLDCMDEAYRKHHMWVRPKLKHGLPSDYFREHCAAEFAEDRSAMWAIEEFGLQNNMMWGNDYPHHEGTFPHSAEAIERQMGGLKEETRAKVLGLNAAKMFRFDIPDRYKDA